MNTYVGKPVNLPVIVKNNSNFIWNAKGVKPVYFSYHWLYSNDKVLVLIALTVLSL